MNDMYIPKAGRQANKMKKVNRNQNILNLGVNRVSEEGMMENGYGGEVYLGLG
jgi:hypothetical protein